MLKYVLVAALVALVAAQTPSDCSSPYQWSAHLLAFDSERHVQVQARYAYDEINQRKARFEIASANNTNTPLQVIELWNHQGGVYYEINLKTQACVKGALKFPFIPHAVLPNATFQGEFYIGSDSFPGAGVLTNAWAANVTSTQGNINWFGTFTQGGCIPIRNQYFFPDQSFFVEDFFDVVLGITDPNVFIPPSQCPP